MQRITISKIGITRINTEIIVNAANSRLQEGAGVCGAIFLAAGSRELQEACDKIGGCKTGDAVITPGFYLCKYIIHAVGPIWHGGNRKEPQQLYSCYQKSLNLAKDNECHSIGFPLISTGIFGYPKDKAWRKALQAINDWFRDNPEYEMEVQFAILDDVIIELGKITAEDLGFQIIDKQGSSNENIDGEKYFEELSRVTDYFTQNGSGFITPPGEIIEKGKKYISARADGDGMLAFGIGSGDYLIIEISRSVESGQLGMFMIGDDHEIVCRMYKKYEDGSAWLIGDINRMPICITEDPNFKAVGRVVGVFRDLKKKEFLW